MALAQEGGHHLIATELSSNAYQTLCQRVVSYGVQVLQGDGLAPLEGHELDAVVIAGMGGRTIAEILKRASTLASRPVFFIQAMQGTRYLHRFLLEQRIGIFGAELVYQKGRYYPTWAVNPYEGGAEHDTDSPKTLQLPTEFRDSPAYLGWLARELCLQNRRFLRSPDVENKSRLAREREWLYQEWRNQGGLS